jgi:hydrogenase maturation protease
MKTLIIGFGNLDRQDDGVAWHVLGGLASRLGRPLPDPGEGFQVQGLEPDFLFVLQLTPELAELAAGFDRVCFVDAHTGEVDEDLSIRSVLPAFQHSPFTHHLTADSLLSFAQTLYGRAPQAILVSVRGHRFGFSQELSAETASLADAAAVEIARWLG